MFWCCELYCFAFAQLFVSLSFSLGTVQCGEDIAAGVYGSEVLARSSWERTLDAGVCKIFEKNLIVR